MRINSTFFLLCSHYTRTVHPCAVYSNFKLSKSKSVKRLWFTDIKVVLEIFIMSKKIKSIAENNVDPLQEQMNKAKLIDDIKLRYIVNRVF